MGRTTDIEWADSTWNLAWGCSKVSPGCKHCYADTQASRFGFNIWGPADTTPRRVFGPTYWRKPLLWNAAAIAAGTRRRVFCSSMCDVFEAHPTIDAERAKLWPLIRATPALDWLILTKRPERIAAALPNDWGEGYPNVWLGTSVENQQYADLRVPTLLGVPAVVHFLSCEPLLGPVTLPSMDGGAGLAHLDWCIVGGESGPSCRPMDPAWVRALRDQCAQSATAFFFKQYGGHPNKRGKDMAVLDGVRHVAMPDATRTRRGALLPVECV